MRYFSVLCILGIAVAVAAPVSATTIPFTQAWDGPVYMHVHNFAQGTTYNGTIWDGVSSYIPVYNGTNWYDQALGTYTVSGSASPLYNPHDATHPLGEIAARAANVNEDGWSVLQIDQIYKGMNIGGNTITPIDITHPLYDASASGQTVEVVGTLFDRTDIGVQFNNTTLLSQTYESVGDTFALYAQATGTFDQGAAGSAGRLISGGTYLDEYASIGFDALGNPIAGSTLVLSGDGAPGFFGTLAATQTLGSVTILGNTATGTSDEYFNALGGTLLSVFDQNAFTAPKVGFPNADLRVHVTDSPNINFADWIVQSSDPLTADINIPEPVTMAGLFLGIGFLGRYIRRRR